ncbi:hypothetical protein D918_04991 [Trichuris suis]|nr:hypothetical protein D918_04991 [Trichuris suis]
MPWNLLLQVMSSMQSWRGCKGRMWRFVSMPTVDIRPQLSLQADWRMQVLRDNGKII